MLVARDFKSNPHSFIFIFTSAALAGGVLYLYWPVLSKLIMDLAQSEDYSYGLLLPLISAYVVYLKWPQILARGWRPSWAGLALMALGFSLYILGELAADLFVPRVSLVVVLAGLVILIGGLSLLRFLAFPLLLLLLMLPLPELLTNKLTLPLQLISSHLATSFLQLLGVSVFQQGNIIDLGVRHLQVVKACSGLRYILPLLALGIIFCYFSQRRFWKVAVLLASLPPLAIVANALRVAAMALYPSLIKGFWHTLSGWLIFIFCLGVLALINRILNYLRPPPPSSQTSKVTPEKTAPGTARVNLSPYLLGALGLLLAAIPLTHRAAYAPPVPLKQSFEHFPMEVGSWRGHFTPIDPEMIKLTQSHAHLNADFFNPDQGHVSLWIAYYETQKKAGGFVHSPKGCLIASGWQFLDTGTYEIAPGRPVNYLLVEQMGARLVVFYWFLQRDRWLTSEYWNKFYMAQDGLLRRRTDGALVRLITPVDGDVPAAKERLAAFARLLVQELGKFMPDNN